MQGRHCSPPGDKAYHSLLCSPEEPVSWIKMMPGRSNLLRDKYQQNTRGDTPSLRNREKRSKQQVAEETSDWLSASFTKRSAQRCLQTLSELGRGNYFLKLQKSLHNILHRRDHPINTER